MMEWTKNLIQYYEKENPGKCPFCDGDVSVEVMNFGRNSLEFKCNVCGKSEHFDGAAMINK
ncbi:MAG: hypothetical protein IIV99_00560 [Oscillospiraceae bacterium]|nr:hypothetical protein [Oscillospiraceae bacterium]